METQSKIGDPIKDWRPNQRLGTQSKIGDPIKDWGRGTDLVLNLVQIDLILNNHGSLFPFAYLFPHQLPFISNFIILLIHEHSFLSFDYFMAVYGNLKGFLSYLKLLNISTRPPLKPAPAQSSSNAENNNNEKPTQERQYDFPKKPFPPRQPFQSYTGKDVPSQSTTPKNINSNIDSTAAAPSADAPSSIYDGSIVDGGKLLLLQLMPLPPSTIDPS